MTKAERAFEQDAEQEYICSLCNAFLGGPEDNVYWDPEAELPVCASCAKKYPKLVKPYGENHAGFRGRVRGNPRLPTGESSVWKQFKTKKAAQAYIRKVEKAGRVATDAQKFEGKWVVLATRYKVFLKEPRRNPKSSWHQDRYMDLINERTAAKKMAAQASTSEAKESWSKLDAYMTGKVDEEAVALGQYRKRIAPNPLIYYTVKLKKSGKAWRVDATSPRNAIEQVRRQFAHPPLPSEFSARKNIKRIAPNRSKKLGAADMQELMRDPQFKKALKLYRKMHGCDPESVSRRVLPIGGKKVTSREFFVSMGKAPAESYEPYQKGSKKKGKIWVHPYDNKPEKVVSADGRTIITLPGTHGVRVIDGEAWIDG